MVRKMINKVWLCEVNFWLYCPLCLHPLFCTLMMPIFPVPLLTFRASHSVVFPIRHLRVGALDSLCCRTICLRAYLHKIKRRSKGFWRVQKQIFMFICKWWEFINKTNGGVSSFREFICAFFPSGRTFIYGNLSRHISF